MTTAENCIGKALTSYCEKISMTLGAGKFHSIANDKN